MSWIAGYWSRNNKLLKPREKELVNKLSGTGCPILGTVLNKVNRNDLGRYYRKYYGKYRKYERYGEYNKCC